MMKLIIVPKDMDALKALDYDDVKEDRLLQVALNEDQFKLLWDASFFHTLNNLTNANIDNFEDESITDKHSLEKVVSSHAFNLHFADAEMNKITNTIKALFLEAINRNTGVFFYF